MHAVFAAFGTAPIRAPATVVPAFIGKPFTRGTTILPVSTFEGIASVLIKSAF